MLRGQNGWDRFLLERKIEKPSHVFLPDFSVCFVLFCSLEQRPLAHNSFLFYGGS